MSTISRPICRLLPLCTVLLLWCGIAAAQALDVQVLAQPNRLTYGNDNRVSLVVNVVDTQGRPAADGTAVYFHTTLGQLPNIAYLKDGRVTVLMDNQTGPGIAVVTVTVGAVRRTVNVTYLGQDTQDTGVTQERANYQLRANQVYYSVDQRVFDLRDQAQLIAPTFTLTAGAIQFSLNDGTIAAQQNITLTTGSHTLAAHSLRLGINGTTGFVIVTEPAIAYQSVTLPTLEVQDSEEARQVDFKPIPTDPTKSWIICRQATVMPSDYIIFRRPKFYVDKFDHQLYSLPYHVLNLRDSGAGLFLSSQLTLTSDAGLTIDFPVYFAATPVHLASLHMRHVVRGSSGYRGQSGFQAGLEDEYLTKHGDGGLYIDDLTRETRSASWEHTQYLGQSTLGLTAAYERYAPDTPYTKRLGLSFYNTSGRFSTRLTANWSALEDDQDGLAELTVQTPAIKLGPLGLSLDPFVGYQRSAFGATETTTKTTRTNFYQGLHAGLSFPRINFLGGTITPTLNNEINRDQDGVITNYLDGGISYRRMLFGTFSSALTYSYSLTSSSDDAADTKPAQRLSFDLSGRAGRDLSLYSYNTYNFESELLYNSLSATYFLPWFRKDKRTPRLYASFTGSMTSGDQKVVDQQMSLGWNIGKYALVVHYSPTGNTGVTGIGTGSGKDWAIELVRSAF